MHLFNTKKQVLHPCRIFLVPWFVCTGVKPDHGQVEAFSAPGGLHLSAKKRFLWCKESLVFLSPTNPAWLALLGSPPFSIPLVPISHRQCLGNPYATKTFCNRGVCWALTQVDEYKPLVLYSQLVFLVQSVTNLLFPPTEFPWYGFHHTPGMYLDLAMLGTVITLVQHKELWILSFSPRLAYASGKERN